MEDPNTDPQLSTPETTTGDPQATETESAEGNLTDLQPPEGQSANLEESAPTGSEGIEQPRESLLSGTQLAEEGLLGNV